MQLCFAGFELLLENLRLQSQAICALYDLRRSAVRNLVHRGVPQKTARTVSGHKTDAVFSRYNIVSEADLRDAARKIEEGVKAALSGSILSSFTVGEENEAKPER